MDALLKFDQVVALSQQTINTQFELLFLNGTIGKSLKVDFYGGSVGIFATLKAPSISILLNNGSVNSQQIRLNINIDTGTESHQNADGKFEPKKIDGFTIGMDIGFSVVTVKPDYAGLKVSTELQSQINPFFIQKEYAVSAILLDPLKASSIIVYKSDGTPDNMSAIKNLISLVNKELLKEGNPYILSMNPKLIKDKDVESNVYKPTAFLFNTHLYNNTKSDSDLSTFNTCIMNEGHALPWKDTTLPKFSQNLIENTDVDGRLFISKRQFEKEYVEKLVLPILKKAMGGKANFSKIGDNWTYKHSTNQDDQNDGHGPVIKHNSILVGNVFGNKRVEDQCELIFLTTDKSSNQILLKGYGSFYIKTDYYKKLFRIWSHDAWASSKKDFDFFITLEAGANGKLTIDFNSSSSAPKTDKWEKGAVKLADLIKDEWGKALSEINGKFASFEKGDFDQFSSQATGAFNILENLAILPDASTFFFKNASLNAEGDLQFDLSIRN